MQPPMPPPIPSPPPIPPPPPIYPPPSTTTTWPVGCSMEKFFWYELWTPKQYSGNCSAATPQAVAQNKTIYMAQTTGLNDATLAMNIKEATSPSDPDPWTTWTGFADVAANINGLEDKKAACSHAYLKCNALTTGNFRSHVMIALDPTTDVLSDPTYVLDCIPILYPQVLAATYEDEAGWNTVKYSQSICLRDAFPDIDTALLAALVVSCGRVRNNGVEITSGAEVTCAVQMSEDDINWTTVATLVNLYGPYWLLQRLNIDPSHMYLRLKMTFSGIMGAEFELASELFYLV